MSAPSAQVAAAATIRQESVRNRYLLGMFAPRKGTEVEEEPLDELADDTEDNPEEDTAEPSMPVKRGTTPSTFGLSFCLDLYCGLGN